MSLNNALIYPVNKIPPYTKKELSNKTPSNIINLFLPDNQLGPTSFKFNEKILPKLVLFKKGSSLKNLNLKNQIPSIKDKSLKLSIKEKALKSNSENKNILENYFNKINYKKKNNSFCYQNNNNKNTYNESSDNCNPKNEKYTKLKLNIKDSKNYASRNKYHKENTEILMYLNKNFNNNNNCNLTLNKQNKKIKTNKSYIMKNKSNFIPKFKTKINLTLNLNQQKKTNHITNSNKYKIMESKTHDKINTYGNIKSNISDKENINNINISNLNETNINESLVFSIPKKNKKKKINLPFSPTSNKDQFFRQIKYRKCYIRNNQNEINIPYNKKIKLTRQNSYYNLNMISFKNQRNKKNNTTREDGSSLADIEIYKKNNSMSSFDMAAKTNANSYSYANTELCISQNENNIQYKVNEGDFGVEMNHFRIIKIIQENKKMLIKREKNL